MVAASRRDNCSENGFSLSVASASDMDNSVVTVSPLDKCGLRKKGRRDR